MEFRRRVPPGAADDAAPRGAAPSAAPSPPPRHRQTPPRRRRHRYSPAASNAQRRRSSRRRDRRRGRRGQGQTTSCRRRPRRRALAFAGDAPPSSCRHRRRRRWPAVRNPSKIAGACATEPSVAAVGNSGGATRACTKSCQPFDRIAADGAAAVALRVERTRACRWGAPRAACTPTQHQRRGLRRGPHNARTRRRACISNVARRARLPATPQPASPARSSPTAAPMR